MTIHMSMETLWWWMQALGLFVASWFAVLVLVAVAWVVVKKRSRYY